MLSPAQKNAWNVPVKGLQGMLYPQNLKRSTLEPAFLNSSSLGLMTYDAHLRKELHFCAKYKHFANSIWPPYAKTVSRS